MPLLQKVTPDGIFTLTLEYPDDIEDFSEESLKALAAMLMQLSNDMFIWIEAADEPRVRLES